MKADLTEINQLVILGHCSPHPYSLLQFSIMLTYGLTSQVDGKETVSLLQLTGKKICRPASKHIAWKDRKGQDHPINIPIPTPPGIRTSTHELEMHHFRKTVNCKASWI